MECREKEEKKRNGEGGKKESAGRRDDERGIGKGNHSRKKLEGVKMWKRIWSQDGCGR